MRREPWEHRVTTGLRPFLRSRQPLDAQLLDRRVVRLWGPLDDATVAKACAEMMALDATGDDAGPALRWLDRRAPCTRRCPSSTRWTCSVCRCT